MRFVAIVLIAVAFASCSKKEKEKEVVLNAVPTVNNEMPAFTATQTDNSQVFFKDVSGRVLLILFNPDCDHCQREAKMLSENKSVLTGWEVYFVTIDQLPAVAQFAKDYNLLEPNIHFGRAEGPDVIRAVGQVTTVPTFFTYNNQKLVGRLEGEISLDKLKEILK